MERTMARAYLKKVILYCSLAYSITWIIAFGIFSMYKTGSLSQYQLNLYHSLAAAGPAIAAFIVTYSYYGTAGLLKLFSRIGFKTLDWNSVFYVFSPVIFMVIGLMIYPFLKNEAYNFSDFAHSNLSGMRGAIVWLLPLITYSVFEEIGWRGFLLPHLQEKYSAFKATSILTVIWALWHIPFFFYRFNFSIPISVGFFFGIFVGAIILTSIYNSGRGMLLPVMLFHFLNNLCSEFDKEIIVAVLSTGFVFIAVLILKNNGPENLSKKERIKNYFLISTFE